MLLETLLKDDPDTEPQGCLGLDVKQAGQPCSPDQPGNPDQPHLEDKDCEAGCPVLGECVRAPPTEQTPYMLQVRWKLGKGPSPGRKARPQKPMLACTYEPTTKKVPFSAVAHEIQLAPAAALPAAPLVAAEAMPAMAQDKPTPAAPPPAAPSMAAMTHDEFFQLSHDFASLEDAIEDHARVDLVTTLCTQSQSSLPPNGGAEACEEQSTSPGSPPVCEEGRTADSGDGGAPVGPAPALGNTMGEGEVPTSAAAAEGAAWPMNDTETMSESILIDGLSQLDSKMVFAWFSTLGSLGPPGKGRKRHGNHARGDAPSLPAQPPKKRGRPVGSKNAASKQLRDELRWVSAAVGAGMGCETGGALDATTSSKAPARRSCSRAIPARQMCRPARYNGKAAFDRYRN